MSLVSQQPTPAQPRPWHFPTFQRYDVSGAEVIAADLPGRPLAVVSLVVRGGAMAEPAGKEGVGELVAAALSEGTKQRDAYGFAVAGERLGASWRSTSSWDSFRCGFEVPSHALAEATALLAEAVREPGFDEATLRRVQDERLDEVRIDRSQPGARAAEAFAAEVFADSSRYHRPGGGDLDSVSAINAADIKSFHHRALSPARASLVVVGDLSQVDVEALGRSVFDGWVAEAADESAHTVRPRATGRRVVVVDRPGSVQSMVYVGHDGPKRSTPDYVPLTTMAMVLGGMFNSRLNMKLREEKGYAYGAFGGFDTRADGGVFVCRAAVQSEVTVPALTDLVAEVERTQANGVDDDELAQAVAYRSGVFPISFAGSLAVASGLGDLVVHNLSDDHYDRLRADVLSVQKDALDAAAATHIRPADLVTVVVGDASALEKELAAADLGPVTVFADD